MRGRGQGGPWSGLGWEGKRGWRRGLRGWRRKAEPWHVWGEWDLAEGELETLNRHSESGENGDYNKYDLKKKSSHRDQETDHVIW